MSEETAVVQTEKVSIDTLPISEFKAARKDGVTEVDVPKTEQKTEVEQPKKLSGAAAQKRIDRLVKNTSALELEVAELKREKAERGKEPAKEATKAAEKGDAEPDQKDFTDYNVYLKALARWEVRQEMKADREKQEKEEKDARMKEEFDKYREKAIAGRAKYDDWEEVVDKSSIEVPQAAHLAIMDTDNPADVIYFLASHPEVCKEIVEMRNDVKAIRAIDKISVALEDGADEDESEDEQETEKPKENEKLVSKAPTPIRPVATGATKSTKALDQLDFRAYKLARSKK